LLHVNLCRRARGQALGGYGFPPYSEEIEYRDRDVSAVPVVDTALGNGGGLRDLVSLSSNSQYSGKCKGIELMQQEIDISPQRRR